MRTGSLHRLVRRAFRAARAVPALAGALAVSPADAGRADLLFASDGPAGARLTTFAGPATGSGGEALAARLDLRPDSTFFLRLAPGEATATSESRDEIGVWELTIGGDTLVLHPSLGTPFRLAIHGHDRLEIASLRGLSGGGLVRGEPGPPIEPSLFLRGRLSTVNGERVFYECATGWRLAVADNREAARLDTLAARHRDRPEEEILASVRGRLVELEGSLEGATPLALVIERTGYVWPGETCARWHGIAALEDAVWRPLSLAGEPLAVPRDAPEPWLRLRSDGHRVEAFGGCNRIGGSYESDDRRLRIRSIHSTRMFCEGRMELEARFAEALRRTMRWKLRLGVLELLDESGERLASFEAKFRP